MTHVKFVIYSIENSIVIILYTFLLALCVHNIWSIIIQKKKWRQPLLMTFYVFCVISIVARWVCLIASV